MTKRVQTIATQTFRFYVEVDQVVSSKYAVTVSATSEEEAKDLIVSAMNEFPDEVTGTAVKRIVLKDRTWWIPKALEIFGKDKK